MSYQYLNKHPKGTTTDDCVVRAISTALNKDYLEVRKDLNQKKREWGFESYKSTKFLYKYLSDYNRILIKVPKGVSRIKGSQFAEGFKNGIYILKMLKHITVCINGVIYDTWDCGYRSVYTAWKVD